MQFPIEEGVQQVIADEQTRREQRHALLAAIYEYHHELTEEDRAFLDEKVEEILATPLPRILGPAESRNAEESEPVTEVDQLALFAGLDYVFQFSGYALPDTFGSVDIADLEAVRAQLVSVLQLAYKCLARLVLQEMGDDALGSEDDDGDWEVTDGYLMVQENFVTGDYLIKGDDQ